MSVVSDDGRRCQLPSVQTQLAFARLALDRSRGTTRDELADTLWLDLPATWAPALRGIVSRVRTFVAWTTGDRGAVVWEHGRYILQLPEGTRIDVEVATDAIILAQRALADGEPDTAFELAVDGIRCLERGWFPDCDTRWVTLIRQNQDELIAIGLETASKAAAILGDFANALMYARQAVIRAPLRESAHRCRITAHMAAGNRAEALRAYEEARRTIAEELGVAPSPATEAIYLALLDDRRCAEVPTEWST